MEATTTPKTTNPTVAADIPDHGRFTCTVDMFLWHRQRLTAELHAAVRDALEGHFTEADIADYLAQPHDMLAVVVGALDGATPPARLVDVCDRDLREAIERCLSPEERARVVVAENTYPSLRRLADAAAAGALPDGTTVLVAMRNHRALRIEDAQAVASGHNKVIAINESDVERLERLRDADLPGDLVLSPYVGARLTTERDGVPYDGEPEETATPVLTNGARALYVDRYGTVLAHTRGRAAHRWAVWSSSWPSERRPGTIETSGGSYFDSLCEAARWIGGDDEQQDRIVDLVTAVLVESAG